MPETGNTWLGQLTAAQAERHPGDSAAVLLDTGRAAFTSRIALADAAEVSLDAQYYIWNADTTGRLLADRLLRAAERGVRVRLLLDDYGAGNKDNELSALDTHSNIEVRVYNPYSAGFRSGLRKWTSMATGFSRLNRRMHSKTFIADNSFAIVGGRNIGDEYFDARQDMNHRDRELLAAGPVVATVGKQFDEMWNSQWAIPISALVTFKLSQEQMQNKYLGLEKFAGDVDNYPYPLPDDGEQRQQLIDSWLTTATWAPAEFVYNPPVITGGDEANGTVIADHLLELLNAAESEILVESAYFIISDELLQRVDALLGERDIRIDALTNSLVTTDVWTIHAGYTRNRKAILQRGIGLYEFRPDAASCRQLVENDGLECPDFKFSLHAKSVVFDRKVVYVGSFNLNPRSRYLNTETALIVHSPALAERIAQDIEENMQPENSWRVVLDDAGQLEWHARTDGVDSVVRHEPYAGVWMRFKSFVFSLFPVEKYL
ncbi:MAG: phospholipase D family protein [Gammaproteobacteria bacterium]